MKHRKHLKHYDGYNINATSTSSHPRMCNNSIFNNTRDMYVKPDEDLDILFWSSDHRLCKECVTIHKANRIIAVLQDEIK